MPHPIGLEVFTIVRNIHDNKNHHETFDLLHKLHIGKQHGYHMSTRLIQEDFILEPSLPFIRAKLGSSQTVIFDLSTNTIYFSTIKDIFNGLLKIYCALNKAGYKDYVSKWIEMFNTCIKKLDDYLCVVTTTNKMSSLKIQRSSKTKAQKISQ